MGNEVGDRNKRIAKNTLMLYVRSIIIILVSLYTSRVTLDVLGVSDYGIYNLVGGLVAMFSLLSGSMVAASQRFITYALGKKDPERLRAVFTTSISLHIVLGLIVVFLLEILGIWFLKTKLNIPDGRMDAAFWVMQCSIVMFFINIISIPYNALIVAHERMSAFAYISILDAGLKLSAAFLLMIIPFDKLILYAILLALFAAAIRFIYSFYCYRHFTESRGYRFKIEKGIFREMFAFAGWNMFGNGSALLRNQGVDILLNMFFGVVVNAAKGVTNHVQSAVYGFVTNFQMAVNPQLTISIAQGDYPRNHQLVIQGGRFSFFLLSLFSIPLIINAPGVLSLWLVDVPPYTVQFIRWTFIYLQLDCLSRFLVTSVLAYGKIRNYQITVGGTKLLALPVVWVVLKLGGTPITGILVNIALEVVCLTMRIFFNHRYNHLPILRYFKEVIVRCWIVFVIAIALAYLFYHYVTGNMFINIPIDILLAAATVWFIGTNEREKDLILSKAQTMIGRKLKSRRRS